MSAQPHQPYGSRARPEKTVLAIRAALAHPKDIAAFESSLPGVVDQARDVHDWTVLDEFVHTWWLIACDAVADPDGRRKMWETADAINRGEPVQTVPWDEVESVLRDRLRRGA